jgi:Predicted helicase
MNALQKKDAIDWLAADLPDDEARVLSNVKFLTEGIDVPNLDAIISLLQSDPRLTLCRPLVGSCVSTRIRNTATLFCP